MLWATVFAWRIANCAVGGQMLPSVIGTRAQSPSAQTLFLLSTRSDESAFKRPLSFASPSESIRGLGEEGTVEIKVLVRILLPPSRIASSLVASDYEVFVAENTAQALGRMREERMDVVLLDGNFDPLEQGVAFITREIKLLRPSERRRLFFVFLTAGVRTMDLHAAFLQNVNLVVNISDIDQLSEALEISIRNYNELYRDLYRALDVVPI